MAFEYRFNAITFYPKNEPPRFAPPEISEPFRFKNPSGWFCGLYVEIISAIGEKHFISVTSC